jgi:hypothetical protein
MYIHVDVDYETTNSPTYAASYIATAQAVCLRVRTSREHLVIQEAKFDSSWNCAGLHSQQDIDVFICWVCKHSTFIVHIQYIKHVRDLQSCSTGKP